MLLFGDSSISPDDQDMKISIKKIWIIKEGGWSGLSITDWTRQKETKGRSFGDFRFSWPTLVKVLGNLDS